MKRRSSFILCVHSGSEMKYFKKNTKNNRFAAVLVVLTVAITTTAVLATITSLSSSFPITLNIAIPAASATPATTGNATNTTSTTTTTTTPPASSSSGGVELSPQPIYEERSPPGTITAINETQGVLTFSGNGMLTLPNTTETINTTHNGTAVLSFTTTSGQGKETIKTEDGETATATVFEIVQFNNPAALGGEGKAIVTAIFQTNSTGVLAPLNGMIAVGVDNISPTDESHITLWKWESGIPLSALAPSTNGTISTTANSTTTTAE